MPLLWLTSLAVSDKLGANPIEAIIRDTGTWALIWLCASLWVTPLRLWTGQTLLSPYRRMFGLFAFAYGSLHFLAYAGWDNAFDLQDIVKDVLKRPFITMGMATLTVLLLLTLTTPKAIIKRLGAKRWKQLHQLVYLAGVLVILHFWWHKAGKNDFTRPAAYGAVIAAAYAARVAHHWRQRQLLIRVQAPASRPATRADEPA